MTIVGAARQASIGAEPESLQVVAPDETLFRFLHQLSETHLNKKGDWQHGTGNTVGSVCLWRTWPAR